MGIPNERRIFPFYGGHVCRAYPRGLVFFPRKSVEMGRRGDPWIGLCNRVDLGA